MTVILSPCHRGFIAQPPSLEGRWRGQRYNAAKEGDQNASIKIVVAKQQRIEGTYG